MSLKASMGQMLPSRKGDGADLRYEINIRSKGLTSTREYLFYEMSFFFRRYEVGNVIT